MDLLDRLLNEIKKRSAICVIRKEGNEYQLSIFLNDFEKDALELVSELLEVGTPEGNPYDVKISITGK